MTFHFIPVINLSFIRLSIDLVCVVFFSFNCEVIWFCLKVVDDGAGDGAVIWGAKYSGFSGFLLQEAL